MFMFFMALQCMARGGNLRRDQRRRGYAVRYTGDDVVYDTRVGTNEHLRSSAHRDGDPLDSERYPLVWPA